MHRSPGAVPLENACLEDLERSLQAFGHPLVRGNVRAWQRFDRRYRQSVSLEWFTNGDTEPAVVLERRSGRLARMRTVGAVDVSVPWLPCTGGESVAGLPIKLSLDPDCSTIAVAGFEAAPADRKEEVVAALADSVSREPSIRIVSVEGQTGRSELGAHLVDRVDVRSILTSGTRLHVDVAGVLHAGLTDDCAFGNVVLAQSGVPAVAYGHELDDIFASDVALVSTKATLSENVRRLVDAPPDRQRYGTLLAADARRRFSPRRTAIRVVDLLCAARFGLERPAPARSNSPLER
ncbi:MAG: hypothetical protein JOY69_01250 [Candidatus Eremiobacteraeota bacterium]|nr:hypothetical protein [Candidatus Eremiobacteraeota bacterium]